MKKLYLAILLIVCVLSLSLSAVSANVPICDCGYGMSIDTQTTETLVGTVPCSHHPGYTDSIYNVEIVTYYYCENCGYYTDPIRIITYTQIVCGYDGSIIIQ